MPLATTSEHTRHLTSALRNLRSSAVRSHSQEAAVSSAASADQSEVLQGQVLRARGAVRTVLLPLHLQMAKNS